MLIRQLVKDRFGQHYKIHTSKEAPVQVRVKPEQFHSDLQASRFIENLIVPVGFWKNLCYTTSLVEKPARNDAEITARIAALFSSGKIKAYKIDIHSHTDHPPSKRTITDGKKNRHIFIPATALLVSKSSDVITFKDKTEAHKYLAALSPDKATLQTMAQELKLPRPSKKDDHNELMEIVASGMASGDIVVFLDNHTTPPAASSSSDGSTQHSDKNASHGPETPNCTIDKMIVQCSHYSKGRNYRLDVLKDKPNLNGVDKALQVIAKPGDPDVITIDYAGSCGCGNKSCPSITIDSPAINGTFTDKPYKFEALPGTDSSKPDGFMDFLKYHMMPEIRELDYAVYNISKGGCNGSENITAKVLAFPTFKWEGSAGFGYKSKDIKDKTSGNTEKKIAWDASLKINGNNGTADWELSYETGSEKPIFPKLQSYLQGFFEQVNKFCSTSKKSGDKPVDIESHVSIGGGVELKENGDDFGVDLLGSFGLNLDPLIKANITYDILDGILSTLSGGIVPFLKKIKAEAEKAKKAAEAIQNGAKKAKEIRTAIKEGTGGDKVGLHGDIAIDLDITGTVGAVLKWQKDLGKPWKTTNGDVVNEGTARIGLKLTGKAEAEADIFFVKVSLGAMFVVADAKDSGKGVGIELKVTATTEKDKPGLSGNVTVTGAAIYYAYWAEVGVKANDSEIVDDSEDAALFDDFDDDETANNKVKKNIKEEKKWTEIFEGWTWPKEDIKKDGIANKSSTTPISNIND